MIEVKDLTVGSFEGAINLIYEDNANYYYLIDEFDLKANENINEYYAIWLSDEYKDVFNNNTLTYKMIVDTNV